MADEDDLDLDGGDTPEETPEPAEQPSSDGRLKKLQSENRSLRTRLRRTELETKHGKDLVGLIPDELPLSKWDEWIEKAATVIPAERPATETAPDKPEAEAPKEEPTPDEQRIAAASVATSNTGTRVAATDMSPRELLELGKKDPTLAAQLIQEKYRAR